MTRRKKRKNTRKKSPFGAGTFVFPNIEPMNYHGSSYFKSGSFKRSIYFVFPVLEVTVFS